MKPFVLCLSLILLFHSTRGWDTLSTKSLARIFPFVSKHAVFNITKTINKVSGTKQSIQVLNAWIDTEWVGASNSTSKAPRPAATTDIGRLGEKEFARKLAISFLEHREFVKLYMRVLKKNTQMLGYFKWADFQKIDESFTRNDYLCQNLFNCTEAALFVEMERCFSWKRKNLTSDVRLLTEPLHKFPKIGEKLKWEFVTK